MDERRLSLEIREMAKRFPDLRPKKLRDGRIGFVGPLRTRSWKTYQILIVLPDSYPYVAPKAFSISPKISTKHQFDDGSLCYHLAHEWSPSYSTCVAVGWVAHWLHAYEVYQRTGDWPGREA